MIYLNLKNLHYSALEDSWLMVSLQQSFWSAPVVRAQVTLSRFYVFSAFGILRHCIKFNSNINNTRNGIEAMGLCQASKVVLCDACIERENKDGDPSFFYFIFHIPLALICKCSIPRSLNGGCESVNQKDTSHRIAKCKSKGNVSHMIPLPLKKKKKKIAAGLALVFLVM